MSNQNCNDNPSKLEVSRAATNRARKSFIPLLRALNSGGSRKAPQPPTGHYAYKSSALSASSQTPKQLSKPLTQPTSIRPCNLPVRKSSIGIKQNVKSVHTISNPGNKLEWNDEDNLIIKVSTSKQLPVLVSSNLNAITNLSLEIGRVAERTRGYFLCPICNDQFYNPAIIACGHLFCLRCVSGWFEDQDNCPCCRYPVIIKDIGNSVMAQEFNEVCGIHVSNLATGNFSVKIQKELPSLSGDSVSLSSCDFSSAFLSRIAPIFKDIVQASNQACGKKANCDQVNNDKAINFISALWFLRHGLQLHYDSVSSSSSLKDYVIANLPEIISEEFQNGSDFSRKSLVIKIMSMKTLDKSGNARSSSSLRLSSKRKLYSVPTSTTHSQPSFRFRMPSAAGFTKMLMATFMLILISLAVHLYDDHDRNYSSKSSSQAVFSKMDLFVYLITIFTIFAYTESERTAFWRQQGQGGRINRLRRGGWRRSLEIASQGNALSNSISLEDLFVG